MANAAAVPAGISLSDAYAPVADKADGFSVEDAYGTSPLTDHVDTTPDPDGAMAFSNDAPGAMGRAFASEAIKGVGGALAGIGHMADASGRFGGLGRADTVPLAKIGGAVTKFGQDAFPLSTDEQNSLPVQVAGAAGGLADYVGAFMVGGTAAVMGTAGLQGFNDGYTNARKAGSSEGASAIAGMYNGLTQAALMAIPFHTAMKVLDVLPEGLQKPFVKGLAAAAVSGTTMTTFSQLSTLADNVIARNTYDPGRPLLQGVGQNVPAQFITGAALPFVGPAAASVVRGSKESAPPITNPVTDSNKIMAAGSVDDAIKTTSDIVSTTMPDISADNNTDVVNDKNDNNTGIVNDLAALTGLEKTSANSHKLVGLFSGLNSGSVEKSGDGTYLYHTTDDAGTPATLPIKVWNPGADQPAAGEDAISPELAKAQTDHYAKLGVDVIYFQNDPHIPFDGAVDPNQPNTIFLSNDPSRNAAQVGAHEVTHVLEDTKLPDGTSLGDLLHQQIRDGITAQGQEYAAGHFGDSAPDRAAFKEGTEGDAQHADAIMAHLVNELGADIGGEAPKFLSFAPKVAEAVEQRYGTDVAKAVLQKFIAGIKAAMETIRGFFGQESTQSQNWVSNLGEIHDTLAQMYAAKYGDHLEIRQTANQVMADRLARGTNVSRETKLEQTPELPLGQPEGLAGKAAQPVSAGSGTPGSSDEGASPGAPYEAPTPEDVSAALDAIRYARSPVAKGNSLFDEIRSLGGIQPDSGGDVAKIMQGVKGKPFQRRVVNPDGLSPDAMRAALQERGWFGSDDRHGTAAMETGSYPGDDIRDMYDLMDREARGEPVFHPDSTTAQDHYDRRLLDEELDRAGVSASDSASVAAQKLADFRSSYQAELLASEENRNIGADAAGLSDAGHERIEAYEYEPGADIGAEHEELGGAERGIEGPDAATEGPQDIGRDGTQASGGGENATEASPELNDPTLFSPRRERFATEPGAEDAQGRKLDQTIIPGAEGDARQVAAAREAQGHGRMVARTTQKEAGGLFVEPEADKPEQGVLFSPRMRDNRAEETREPFYSALTRGVEDLKMDKAPPGQWLSTIRNMPGIKSEERDWSGVEDWLKGQTKSVTKAEVVAHLRENEVRVQEIVKSEGRTVSGAHINDVVSWAAKNKPEIRSQIDDAAMAAGRPGPGDNQQSAIEFLKSVGVPERLLHPFRDAALFPGDKPKFASYTLPGGEPRSYRELLLTLPNKTDGRTPLEAARDMFGQDVKTIYDLNPEQQKQLQAVIDKQVKQGEGQFRTSHFDEPNILAHIRFDDRTGPNGEKMLHIAEIQSDWHQKGRRGGYATQPPRMLRVDEGEADLLVEASEHQYTGTRTDGLKASVGKGVVDSEGEAREYLTRYLNKRAQEINQDAVVKSSGGVPDAPFKSSWQELAAKRMLRYAAEHGYDRLSWDTGKTAADRFDLNKQIDDVLYRKEADGQYYIGARKDGKRVLSETYPADRLPDVLGKDVAQKIIDGHGEDFEVGGQPGKRLTNLDLKVGGAGMVGFYDKILPQFLSKYAKKWGAKVEDIKLGTAVTKDDVLKRGISPGAENTTAHSIEITPAMRESVMDGQALFSTRVTAAMKEQDIRRTAEYAAKDGNLPGIDRAATPPPPRLVSSRPGELPGIIQTPAAPEKPTRALAAKSIEGTGEEKQRSVSPGQTYKVGEEKPQIEAAARLVSQDYDKAIAVAMREVQPPPDVHPQFVFMAVEDKATMDGDQALLDRLATSRIAEEATTMGQQTAAWRHRDPLSAVAALRSVANARDNPKAVAKEVDNMQQQMAGQMKKASALRPKSDPWARAMAAITCAS